MPQTPDWSACSGLRVLVCEASDGNLDLISLLDSPPTVVDDTEVLRLRAGKEIRIECGNARIHLRADGRIEIRGERLLHRAKELIKLKGGAVSIN